MHKDPRHLGIVFALLIGAPGCGTETPTEAIVVNSYPSLPDGGAGFHGITVYRAWWETTLFRAPVAPGQKSDVERTVPGSARAYAVLAVGWDPSLPGVPLALIPVQSNSELIAARGDTLRVVVSDETFIGRCGGSKPLTQEEADLITQSIFPDEFAGVRYDASTCSAASPAPEDSGVPDARPDKAPP
jgi:hypothetical protein